MMVPGLDARPVTATWLSTDPTRPTSAYPHLDLAPPPASNFTCMIQPCQACFIQHRLSVFRCARSAAAHQPVAALRFTLSASTNAMLTVVAVGAVQPPVPIERSPQEPQPEPNQLSHITFRHANVHCTCHSCTTASTMTRDCMLGPPMPPLLLPRPGYVLANPPHSLIYAAGAAHLTHAAHVESDYCANS